MANIKISDLSAAAAATDTQEFEVNDSLTSKKVTGAQILAYVESEISSSPAFTGQVTFEDGSASAPSITNAGDTNAGIFFPAADTIGFATNGSEQVRITSTGSVGIGTSSPGVKLAISSTDAILIPAGTTAERPTGAAGLIRYNSTLGKFEGYTTAWGFIGGGATGGGTDEIFIENGQTVTTNYTISSGKNAGTFGPITIDSGVTVTVPSGSTWTVV